MDLRTRTRAALRRTWAYAGRRKHQLRKVLVVGAPGASPIYEAWVAHEGIRVPARPELRDPSTGISILMAVHDPPIKFLREAVDSVLDQSSSNWELVLSDDGSTDPAVLSLLRETASLSGNVTLVTASQSGGIVAALNRALDAATLPYVGVLDHDDRLHPRAVEVVTHHLATHQETDLAYSDEDKIDPSGRHFDPYFKPDFSPELLLAVMYLNHFTAMRTPLVRSVGAFRKGTDGAQDHDLAFRMIRDGAVVTHVPGVLYHWRAWEQSTASGIQAKPWAQTAAARVQRDHLAAIGFPGVVEPSPVPGLNEIHPGVLGRPRVSVVIPTMSRPIAPGSPGQTHVAVCLQSLQRMGGWSHVETIVVHTGEPTLGQRRLLEELADHLVVHAPGSFNFSEAINLGADRATGEYLLILNDDTQVHRPNSIRSMLEIAQLPGVGAVGARLTYPDGRNQHSGILFLGGLPSHASHLARSRDAGYFGAIITPRNYLAVTGAALMTPLLTFRGCGGLDPALPGDFQDIDYCLRLRERGLRIAYTPYAHFVHAQGASMARRTPTLVDAALFLSRWGPSVGTDPYYSPMLDQQFPHMYEPI
jgi:GT2 family glycosyltransferase